ncbi:MAG: creatininase family protein [Chloroflexota bacterium]|nr:creatininase family protein [Chloroflexota bacterium]
MYYDLERMTHDDVSAAIAAGTTTIILPVGAIEQHGYHCPMGMDSMVAELVGRQFAEKLGCFYAPVQKYGMSMNHKSFPGSMALTPTTLALVVRDLIVGLANHGFREIVVLNSHGGNTAALGVGTREAKDLLGGDVLIANGRVSEAMRDSFSEIIGVEPGAMDPREFSGHGSVMEIALALLYDPTTVKPDNVVLAPIDKVIANERSSVSVVTNIEAYSESGTFGSDTGAFDEGVGERLVDAAAEQLKRDFLQALEMFGHARGVAAS